MKRFSVILALILVCLCACKSEPVEIDIDAAAEKLLAEVEFYEELYPTDLDMAKSLLALDDGFDGEIAMYVGSGASADAVIVAKGDILGKIEAYLASQEELYASYMIFEAEKISHAVVKAKDNYVIVCITEDTENAEKVVKEILG